MGELLLMASEDVELEPVGLVGLFVCAMLRRSTPHRRGGHA